MLKNDLGHRIISKKRYDCYFFESLFPDPDSETNLEAEDTVLYITIGNCRYESINCVSCGFIPVNDFVVYVGREAHIHKWYGALIIPAINNLVCMDCVRSGSTRMIEIEDFLNPNNLWRPLLADQSECSCCKEGLLVDRGYFVPVISEGKLALAPICHMCKFIADNAVRMNPLQVELTSPTIEEMLDDPDFPVAVAPLSVDQRWIIRAGDVDKYREFIGRASEIDRVLDKIVGNRKEPYIKIRYSSTMATKVLRFLREYHGDKKTGIPNKVLFRLSDKEVIDLVAKNMDKIHVLKVVVSNPQGEKAVTCIVEGYEVNDIACHGIDRIRAELTPVNRNYFFNEFKKDKERSKSIKIRFEKFIEFVRSLLHRS